MTLRRRLTGQFVLVALISILLASLAGALLVRYTQVTRAERNVRLIGRLILRAADDSDSASQDRRLMLTVAEIEGVHLLEVRRDGMVMRDSVGALEGVQLPVAQMFAQLRDTPGQVLQVQIDGARYFVTPVLIPPIRDRELVPVVAVPQATVMDSWLTLLPGVLTLSLLGSLIAAVLGWSVAPRLAAPLEALSAAADRIASGDYSAQVEVPGEIREVEQLAASFNSMARQVRQARQTQREFFASVSHDLRTPLTSISGFSQAMMERAVAPDQVPRIAGIIHTEATRLSRLVGDLLDLARLDAGRFQLHLRPIDLAGVLGRCGEKFAVQARDAGLSFQTEIPDGLGVQGDADRLEQVVTNLVDNALTHAQEGGGHVRLLGRLAPEPAGDWVEIRVTDDGPGISASQKERIFERFHQGAAPAAGGLGLGLAIAREIVEAHGGQILVLDGAESGSEFVVRFPHHPG